jgi:maltose O-acetyltransferase
MALIKKLISFIFWFVRGSTIIFRSYLYSILFNTFGKKTYVIGNITAIKPNNIKIGHYSTLNEGVLLNAEGKITIGNHVHISPYVIINAGYLDLNNFSKKLHKSKPVTIKDHVWLCSGVIINPGVTIGKGAVVASGAVVTKDVKAHTLVVGIPAKFKKQVKWKSNR